MQILEQLFALQDLEYRDFHARLMPTIAKESIIGIRTPALRKLAKELHGTEEATEFLKSLPHKYYEENNLHAFLIERIKDYDACIYALNEFLPYVDNWATCDSLSPKVLGKHLPELLAQIPVWLASGRVYTVRFGIEQLMTWFLDEQFLPEYLQWVAAAPNQEYYVNMMVAWYFATALAKQYAHTLPYLTEKQLPQWVHNKTIQKAVESYRITAEQKAYLKTLRMK